MAVKKFNCLARRSIHHERRLVRIYGKMTRCTANPRKQRALRRMRREEIRHIRNVRAMMVCPPRPPKPDRGDSLLCRLAKVLTRIACREK